MTVALDEDLLAPMLAGYGRAYVFRAAGKIFAVTNKEQGFGELVTIIEPTPRPEESARTASVPTGPIARRVRTVRPPRAPYSSPELKSKRARAIGGDRNGNASLPALGDAEQGFPYLSGAGRLVLKDTAILAGGLLILADSALSLRRKLATQSRKAGEAKARGGDGGSRMILPIPWSERYSSPFHMAFVIDRTHSGPNRKGDHQMFSLALPNVTRAQLRNSVKILGAAAIVLLAAGNTLANAAENPARIAQKQHACAVVLGLDPSGRRYDACIRSLERSWSAWDFARAVSTDRRVCAGAGLQPSTPAFAVCVAKAAQSP